jgi:Na+/melibiose symporter-like transporter
VFLWRTPVGRSYVLRFCDGLATTTLGFAIPLMIYHVTQSLAWSGLAFFIEWIPRIVALPISSPFVDALGSRRIFMVTNAARALVLGCGAALLLVFSHTLLVLLGIAVIVGMLAQCSFVAAEHLGVHITDKSVRKTQSVQVGIDQTVQVLGPVVGGLLFLYGQQGVLLGVGVLAAISAVTAYTLSRKLDVRATKSQPSPLVGLRRGMNIILASQSLRTIVAGTAAFNILLGIILATTPALTSQRFGSSAQQLSMLWAGGALAAIVAVFAINTFAKRINLAEVSLWAGVVAAVAAIAASMAPSFVMYMIAIAVFMAMDGIYAVFIRTARAHIVPSAEYGVTVGVIVLLTVIPFPLAGLLTAVTPVRLLPALVVMGGLITVVTLGVGSTRIDRTIFAQQSIR